MKLFREKWNVLIVPFALRQWPLLVVILALTACNSLLAALQPWPLKLLVDYGLRRQPLPPGLGKWIGSLGLSPSAASLVALSVAASLLHFLLVNAITIGISRSWAVAGQHMVLELSTRLFHRLQRISPRYHRFNALGDSLGRLTTDSWCVYTLTSQLFSPIEQILTLCAIGCVTWQLDSRLATFALLSAPLLGLASIYFGRRLKSQAKTGREAESRLLSFVHQTLAAMPLVQAFSAEQRNSRRFELLAADAAASTRRNSLLGSAYGLTTGLISTTGAAMILFVGGREVIDGRLSLGGLLLFFAYMQNLQNAAENLLRTYGNLKPVEASIDRVLEVLSKRDDDIAEPEHPLAFPRVPARGGADIRLTGVTFGYDPGRPVLKDINLVAQAGEMVALVGATGAGKSTLVSLIPRFFDPWAGCVQIGGVDVRRMKIGDLRGQVAVVMQEPFLFPRSLAENIAYGRPGASREEIIEAARAANADAFIRTLPEGYDTIPGMRGATLSGGERQRIAIARALLKNAPVLILDEPTSALDAKTEFLVMQALEHLMAGRTTVVVAHRLSTIRRADRIVVIAEGKVAESGTHHQLLKLQGTYFRLQQLHACSAVKEAVA